MYNENDVKRYQNLFREISGVNNPSDCFNIYKLGKIEYYNIG